MKRSYQAAIAAVMIGGLDLGLGCSSHSSDDAPPSTTPLALAPVAWNPANADVGTVAAVVEEDKKLALFG
jgi:hypothetical protein